MGTLKQPTFAPQLQTLAFPMTGGGFGPLQRGFMRWDDGKQPKGLITNDATVHFLFNPASVTADYAMSFNYGATLQFPVPGDQSILRVPLSQTVQWSLLFDRTYELIGAYTPGGVSKTRNGASNDPAVVGVMADIYQLQQFTGMTVTYTTSGKATSTVGTDKKQQFTGHQGILQLIPSFVYFGGGNHVLYYYGYISEWSVEYTHFTQKMVPQRAAVDITMTMLPHDNLTPTANAGAAAASASTRQSGARKSGNKGKSGR